jgi:hypothetical protein
MFFILFKMLLNVVAVYYWWNVGLALVRGKKDGASGVYPECVRCSNG